MRRFAGNDGVRLVAVLLLFQAWKPFELTAQFRVAGEVLVEDGGQTLVYPWVGGFNQPQVSAFDLNEDGWEDLIVFDKSGTVFSTFLHSGEAGSADYRYAPEYESAMPARSDWVLFRDYNGDGLPDLFSYTSAGFGVWKAQRNALTGMPFFTQVQDQVRYIDGALRPPVFTSRADLPAFADVNGDGDLDIITFGTFGGFIRYFENLSVENGWDADSLLFTSATDCWGNWFEGSVCRGGDLDVFCRPAEELDALRREASVAFREVSVALREASVALRAHAGSTICPLDHDGDGDLDMLMGDAGCNNLVLIRNGGTLTAANITGQDTAYPKTDLPVDFATFLAPFHLDINQDGRGDLLVAPNDDSEARNARMLWYYRNQSVDTVDLAFEQEDFLLAGMLDEGAETRVHIADLTADGLPDLLVGRLNRVDGSGAQANGLTFFRNTGSASLSAFERVSNDYAGLSALGRQGLAPTTADLDGDGDLDLLVGDIGGNLHFYRNVAAAGMPAEFTLAEADFQGINLGVQAVPALYDLDRDGRPDLLLGERNGNLNYLRNIGTSTAPAFLLETEFWGAVDTRRAGFTVGSSAPFLRLNEGNQTELYIGSQSGYLYRYGNIDGNLLGTFDLVDSSWGGLLPGLKSSIALADFNGDTIPDVLLGNIRGGLQLFTSKGVPPPVGLEPAALPNLQIWPNPASSVLYVRWPVGLESGYPWKLLNSSGQVMLEGEQGPDLALVVADLPRGLYFFAWTAKPAIGAGGVPGIRSGSGVSGANTSGHIASGNSPVTYVIKIMLLP